MIIVFICYRNTNRVFSQGCSHEFSGAGDLKELGGILPAHFQKKASMIVTANCPDEYREVMGEPCFETMGGHLMIEQIETVDNLYVGGVENMSGETLSAKLDEAYHMGIRLVEEIEKARQSI